MKIAVLGAGAMGMLIGGYLSRGNDVTLIDVDAGKAEAINREGIRIIEPDGSVTHAHPRAATGSEGMEPAELLIVFVKAMYTESALAANRRLIGPGTRVLTLQNGAGHEALLARFVARAQIVIGTTQHNSSVVDRTTVHHGAGGPTFIGVPEGSLEGLRPIVESFRACGLACEPSAEIQRMIWRKLFTNASASVLTGVLQTPMGFLLDSADAWAMTETLLREAVDVANGDGMGFEYAQIAAELQQHLAHAREGKTSIYADLRAGRKTEVDTINGSVARASRRNGVPAPSHEFMVHLVHALESRQAPDKEESHA